MKLERIILFSFICVLVADATEYMFVSMQMGVATTYLESTMKFVCLFLLLYLNFKTNWKKQIPQWPLLFFRLMIGWSLINIVRGFFTASTYFEWKYLMLFTSFSLLVPYTIVVGMLYERSREMYKFIVTGLFLYGFIIIPLTIKLDPVRELFARGTVICVSFFILLSPYYKLKWRVLTFIVAAVAAYLSFDFRTNVLRILIASMIFCLFYVRKYIPLFLLKAVCLLFLIAPLVFMLLAINDQFNIFRPTDDIDKYEYAYENGDEKNVAQDTRTFLFQEQFASMKANHSFIFGEGGAGTYKTEFFEDQGIGGVRPSSEVGFLNTLLYAGIIGVLLHACLLFSAVFYGINYSNNFLCKMIAVFLAFRWVLFFVEDYPRLDMNYYFIWVAVGLCFSKGFRSLSDADITQYFSFKLPAR